MKVLFCGRDLRYAYVFTKDELADDPDFEVIQCDRAAIPTELEDADVIVPLLTPRIPGEWLVKAPALKLIIQYGVGVENIDIPAATELGVWVSNIPSAGTGNAASCAEMAIFLTLATLRHVHAMHESIQQQVTGLPLGTMLKGQAVLVVGFGNIAKELIVRLKPFGVAISALRRSPHWGHDSSELASAAEAALHDRGTWPQDVPRLAAAADIIVLTCHQDANSAGMLNSEFLGYCKRGVRIVNVARGGLMDYDALRAGLESGHIGGMGLDVQPWEPFDPEDPIAKHPSVFLTPHVAGVTEQSCEFEKTRKPIVKLKLLQVYALMSLYYLDSTRTLSDCRFRTCRPSYGEGSGSRGAASGSRPATNSKAELP